MPMLEVYCDFDADAPEGLGTAESPANLQQLYDNDDWYYSYGEGTVYKIKGVYRYEGLTQEFISLESYIHSTANTDAKKIFEAWNLALYGPWGFVGDKLHVTFTFGSKKDTQEITARDFFCDTEEFVYTAVGTLSEGGKYYNKNAYINTEYFNPSPFDGLCDVDWFGCSILPKNNVSQIHFDFFNVNSLQRYYYCYFGHYYHDENPGNPVFNAWKDIHPDFLEFHKCYFENALADELGHYITDTLFTLAGDEVIDKDNIGHVPANPVPAAADISMANKALYRFSLFSLPEIADPVVRADFVTKDISTGLFNDDRIAIGAFEFGEDEELNMSTGKTIVAVQSENGLADIDFKYADPLYNNIWLSLMTKKGSRFNDPEFGSRMYELKARGGKITSGTLNDAVMFSEQSLQWMIKTGRISSVSVKASQNSEIETRIDLIINLLKANNSPITYTLWYDVI